MVTNIIVLQTCLPDYRLPFFKALVHAIPRLQIACGQSYFTTNLALVPTAFPWRLEIRNRFFCRRHILWQSGVIGRALRAELVIAEFNPRIVSTWFIVIGRRLFGRKTILWGHVWGRNSHILIARLLRLSMLRLADGAITYTISQATDVNRYLPRLPVWAAQNSCVYRDACVPATDTAGSLGIVYVGRLIEDKKPLLLVTAFSLAIRRLPLGCKLFFVGEGPERVRIEKHASDLGLHDRVIVYGYVSDATFLRSIYADAFVAVSPGYVGLSAIQAMAHGLPLIVSRNEPHSPEIEACIDGSTALFVDSNAPTALAEALISVDERRNEWFSRRREISAFIASRYTYEGMVDTFCGVVDKILPRRSPCKTIGVVWAHFGPYHFARLRALQTEFGANAVTAIEIANKTTTYPWNRPPDGSDALITLLPGEEAESVSSIAVYNAALRVLNERNVCAVFIPGYWPATSVAVLLAAKTLGIRAIMMSDSHAATAKARGISAVIKKWLIRSFDAAFVAGELHKKYFIGLGIREEKIQIGCDVVDNDFFTSVADDARKNIDVVRKVYGLPRRYFLSVGRMVAKKNLVVLVDAYAEMRARETCEWPRLVFIGDGVEETTVRRRCVERGLAVFHNYAAARDPNIDADVLFLGSRQINELPQVYALAVAFILPSREEEWGLVVNEAMACGTPVIVSRQAGCSSDLIQHRRNGLLFDALSSNELANCMVEVARKPQFRDSLGAAGRETIKEWSCERFARSVNACTQSVL